MSRIQRVTPWCSSRTSHFNWSAPKCRWYQYFQTTSIQRYWAIFRVMFHLDTLLFVDWLAGVWNTDCVGWWVVVKPNGHLSVTTELLYFTCVSVVAVDLIDSSFSRGQRSPHTAHENMWCAAKQHRWWITPVHKYLFHDPSVSCDVPAKK